jgi:CubicO group peptidase (beta-lactamase class C family)
MATLASPDDGWKQTSFAEENLDATRFAQLEERIESDYFRQIRSVVVVKRGRLLYESYFNGADASTLQDIRSAGKSITSMLVGIAIDRGFITGVNERLLPYFPEYDRKTDPDARKDRITLEDALTMRIGLDVPDGDYSTGSYGNVETYRQTWTADVLGTRVVDEPGTRFEYSSAASSLCGPVIARASGRSVPEFAAETLFEPLGITDYRWTFFPDGSACTAGSFWIRPRDLAKLGLLMARGGQWNGERILSQDWVSSSTAEHVNVNPSVGISYGYFWWRETYLVGDRRIPCFFAQGNGGNRIHVFPTEDLVIVVTSNAYSQPYMFDQVRAMIYRFILPASILPSGSVSGAARLATVPWTGLVLAGAVFLSAIVIWPARAMRLRKRREQPIHPEGPAWLRYLARTWGTAGALVHLLFVVLIFITPSFELFLNTGYEYVIPTEHLTMNWLILVFALGTTLCAIIAWAARLWSTLARFHYTFVALSGLYLLFLLIDWEALILRA